MAKENRERGLKRWTQLPIPNLMDFKKKPIKFSTPKYLKKSINSSSLQLHLYLISKKD